MNYDKKKNDFVTVRESTGGGIRTVAFPDTANRNDILSTCKELFFPEGISKFEKLSNMDVKLGNFKRDVIQDVYSFNLANYIKANKLAKTRLNNKLSPSQLIKSMNSTVNVSDSDEDSDDSFLDFIYSDRTIRCEPCAKVGTVHQSPSNDLPQNNLAKFSPITPDLLLSQFICSSTERTKTKLLSKIDQAYQESLKVDQLKGNYEKEQRQSKPSSSIPNFEQAQRIPLIRQARVVTEPGICQESIVASVRHVTLGLIRRSFPKASMMNAIYDWVGSFSDFPVFFLTFCKTRDNHFPIYANSR